MCLQNQEKDFQTLLTTGAVFHKYLQFQQEILLETYDSMVHSQSSYIQKNIQKIGTSAYYHQLSYHQNLFISVLYFSDTKLIENYYNWRYTLYWHSKIDLDFLYYELECFQGVVKKILEASYDTHLDKLFHTLFAKHKLFTQHSQEKTTHTYSQEVDTLYSLAITNQKKELINMVAQKVTTVQDFCEYFNTYISEVIQKVGRMWQTNNITVAQEHIASSTLEEMVYTLFAHFEPMTCKNKTIVLSTAPFEQHHLGILIASKILESIGYSVVDLGSNTPSDDIIKSISHYKPDYLLLAATLPPSLYEVAKIIKELKTNQHNHTTSIIVAGHAITHLSNPKHSLHADKILKDFESLYRYFLEPV